MEIDSFDDMTSELDKEGMDIVNVMTVDNHNCLHQPDTNCESSKKDIELIKPSVYYFLFFLIIIELTN